MIHDYKIQFENVNLRPLAVDDIEYLRQWRNNPDNTVFLKKIPYITPKMQIDWFKNYLSNDNEICFAVVENNDLNRLVGSVSLYEFENDTCLFGKLLIGDKAAHGKMIGLNATISAIRIAFYQLNLKKVKLYVYEENKIALKIYKEAGFIVSEEHKASNGKNEYTMAIKRGVM